MMANLALIVIVVGVANIIFWTVGMTVLRKRIRYEIAQSITAACEQSRIN